MFTDML